MKNYLMAVIALFLFSCEKVDLRSDTQHTLIPSEGLSLNTLATTPQNVFSVSGKNIRLNGINFKMVGLRCSNALISDTKTNELIGNLDVFRSYGVNTISVFIMGSRFGNIKGYNPDATLNTIYSTRLGKIISAANERGMVILVGCLYWSTSTANDDISNWTQTNVNSAIGNTVKWLKANNYRNVLIDPDNEGMAQKAKGWSTSSMINAANAVDASYVIGYNSSVTPIPSNADILLHHSPKDGVRPWIQSEGSPGNAPGQYWNTYSKTTDLTYYNYIRIGRYNSDMKTNQLNTTYYDIANQQGYILASTWLQCSPDENIGGPFMKPGGMATGNIDASVKTLQADAGILWWLQAVKAKYGSWTISGTPPPATTLVKVDNFTLINATTDADIKTMVNGETITRSVYNIRANTTPATVGKVVFVMTGTQSKNVTENIPAYALFGNTETDYNSWTPSAGSYTLKATPYSTNGTVGESLTINFNVN